MKKKEIQLGSRNQLTIPKEFVDQGVTLFVCEKHDDGTLVLHPRATVPYGQRWFWSRRWQKGEQAASADIRAGRLKPAPAGKTSKKALGRKRGQ